MQIHPSPYSAFLGIWRRRTIVMQPAIYLRAGKLRCIFYVGKYSIHFVTFATGFNKSSSFFTV